jgi:hypothetical protein
MIRNAWRGLFVLAMVLATVSAVSAQSIIDARRLEFVPSTDHNALDATTGDALVQSYSLQVFLAGGAMVQTVDLGKPTPEADGLIRLDFVSWLSTPLTPGEIYEAVVAAVGPGGSSASAPSNTFAFGVACTPSISPPSQSVEATGGTGNSTVTVSSGCLWTAVSNNAWITVSSGASSSGSGTVTFSIAANTGTTSRTGTLTIAGSTFTVTQAGAAPCAPAISLASTNVTSAGITGTVTVTAASGCAWTATSNAAWLTISAGATGSGNGSVTYTVAPNTATTSRTGTLTIGGNTFTVTQAGAPCTSTISTTSANVTSAGITGTVTVTASSSCAWTASSNATWISISAGATGSGNGSVT